MRACGMLHWIMDAITVTHNKTAVNVAPVQHVSEFRKDIQCVSKKNIPDIFSCNSRKHYQIFIIFGTHVTEKVSNQ